MAKEKCPHCTKKKPDLSEVQVRVAGNTLVVRICEKCRISLEKIMSFASAFPTASAPAATAARPASKPAKRQASTRRARANDEKFAGYALSPEEIKRTQAMRPSAGLAAKYRDPRKRDLDSMDKPRVRVFSEGPGREKRIVAKAQKELRCTEVRRVFDDGMFEAVFEAA